MRRWTNSLFIVLLILVAPLIPACSDDSPTEPPDPGPRPDNRRNGPDTRRQFFHGFPRVRTRSSG